MLNTAHMQPKEDEDGEVIKRTILGGKKDFFETLRSRINMGVAK